MTPEFVAERQALISLIRGYRTPQVLFLANQLGVFDRIPDMGATAESISMSLGADPFALRLLLNALVGLKILGLSGSHFRITEPLQYFLRRDGPHYLGNFIRSAEEENAYWASAADMMHGRPSNASFLGEMRDAMVTGQVLKNVELSNHKAVAAVWPELSAFLPRVRQFIDVGAGHGAYTVEILKRVPEAHATIYDLPFAIRYCQSRHQGEAYFSRMTFVCGDVRDLDHEQAFDLVLMNDLLVYFPRVEKLGILKRALRALRRGGMLAMAKIRLDSSGCTPAFGAMFSLNIAVTTGSGYLEGDQELVDLVAEAGFREVTLKELGSDRSLVMARR
jgi:ubiquinone/menaquinone biosynthesis C-methylase UbiE